MCKLEVKIDEKEKTYPIFINNEDIENIDSAVLNQIGLSARKDFYSQRRRGAKKSCKLHKNNEVCA